MDIQTYELYNPLDAALSGRDEPGQAEIYAKFTALPDVFRQFLVAPDTAQRIADWEREGLFPPNYRTAIAKTLMLAAFGDVQPEAIGTLFTRIGLPQSQANEIAADIRGMLEPYLISPELSIPEVELDPEAGASTEFREVPPLTTTETPATEAPESNIPTAEEPSAVSNQTSRTIIDLRKPQKTQ